MTNQSMSPFPEVILCLAVLVPASLSSQVLAPPGRLQITSTPVGATITINGQSLSNKTPVTIVVSAGAYEVTVRSADGQTNCDQKNVSVTSNETVAVDCSGTTGTVKKP
jgi:hypothetical protein